jgi:hypothetical protein
MGPRDQPVVDGQLVGQVPPFGHADRIHVADEIGDRCVRRGELFRVPAVARQPAHGSGVALLGDQRPARGADRTERVVVDLAADHDRRIFVK